MKEACSAALMLQEHRSYNNTEVRMDWGHLQVMKKKENSNLKMCLLEESIKPEKNISLPLHPRTKTAIYYIVRKGTNWIKCAFQ